MTVASALNEQRTLKWIPRFRVAAGLMIAGPLICIAGGRWGAYLQVPGTPVFLTDITTLAGVAGLTTAALFARRRLNPVWALLLVPIGLVVTIGLTTPGPLDELAHDIAPFVYLSLIPWFVEAVRVLGRDATLRLVGAAALFHLAWYVLVTFGLLPRISAPLLAGIPVFSTRNDIDELLAGLAVAVALGSTVYPRPLRLVVVAASAASILGQGSRGGLLGALALIVVVLLLVRPWRTGRPVRWVAVSAGGVAALGISALLTSGVPTWARTVAKFVPSGDREYASADNTADARRLAWDDITAYLNVTGHRTFGYGFGNSVIRDSGALTHLSGDPSVRYAHNFVYSWQGEVGLVGLGLIALFVIIVMLAGLVRAFRTVPSSLGAGLVAGLVTAGAVGVVLESPFGYEVLAFALALPFTDAVQGRGVRTIDLASRGARASATPR